MTHSPYLLYSDGKGTIFEDTTLYETHRGLLRFMRKLFHPLLKMMFNPNPIVHVLHMQGQINNINCIASTPCSLLHLFEI